VGPGKVKHHLPDHREPALVSDGVKGSPRWTKLVELNFGCYSLCRSWRHFAAAAICPFSVWTVLCGCQRSIRYAPQDEQKQVRVVLKNGDIMRFLCCLLLGSSVLLSDADAQKSYE
jgi:hypothetical protein